MGAVEGRSVAFVIRGPIRHDDLPGLCDRVCALLRESGASVAFCEVSAVRCDAVTVDALARLQLAARRAGCQVRLRGACTALVQLVDFMGLTDVLPDEPAHVQRSNSANDDEGGAMATRMIFPNLAVSDLERSIQFFTSLGFTFDERMTDETATAMIVNEQAMVMLLLESRFADFVTKPIADPNEQTESILALSAESREEVDVLADTALANGGSPAKEPLDLGFMYGRSFRDPDGHHWEIFWMDPAALEGEPAGASAGGQSEA